MPDDMTYYAILSAMYRLVHCISRYEYTASNGAPSFCSVEIWNRGASNVVLFRELTDNPGMSVTNASELLAKMVCDEFAVPRGSSTRFFECYADSYDEIKYKWIKGCPSNPEWRYYGEKSDFRKFLTNGDNS